MENELVLPNEGTRKSMNTLPIWWLALSLVYILLQISDHAQNIFALVLGLFVPIGFWNALVIFEFLFTLSIWKAVLAAAVVLATVFKGETIFRRVDLTGITKAICILLTLFVVTIVVDELLHGKWQSYQFLLEKGIIKPYTL